MEYKNLQKYLEKKNVKPGEKQKPTKDFKSLSANEKWALVEELLRNLGYID